jgi:hypothetical protein
VALTISVGEGRSATKTARLECRGRAASAQGFLGEPSGACARARRLSAFLRTPPRRGRICAQLYGGPQTARIRGTIGGQAVARRFSRTDSCEIADWDRLGPLLSGGS